MAFNYAYKKRKRSNAKRKLKKLRRKNVRRRSKARAPLRNAIRSVMRSAAETKYVGFYTGSAGLAIGSYNPGTQTWPYIYPVGPFLNPDMGITQGTNNSQRIGNQVRTKKLTFRLIVTPLEYIAGTNENPEPFMFCIYFGYAKRQPSTTQLAPFNDFFTIGNTDVSPSGNLLDTFHHVNKDKFVIKKKDMFKVGNRAIHTANPVPHIEQNYANNDFPLVVKRNYDLTGCIPKVITYNDQVDTPTNTTQLFVWFEAVGVGGARNTGKIAQVWMEQRYEFTDP